LYALAPLDWLPPAIPGGENRFLAESLANYNAAKWLRAAGRSAEAEVAIHRSIAVGESVPARYPGQVWMAYCWCQQAQARFLQGQLHSEAGRLQEAEADYRQSLALFAKLKPEDMDALAALPVLARLEAAHGELLWCQGKKQEAASAFHRAEQTWRQIKSPGNSQRHNELAWFLATCPDEHFRKLDEAVALSEKAVTQQPKEASFWRTRGLALFRAGRHQDAAEALEKGMRLGDGGDAADWFFLAMTRWKLDDKTKARERFHRAVEWMRKNRPRDPVLRRFHAEAAALLEMREASTTPAREVSLIKK
jgi:tetratricopeptide (TPR) repeat protein